MRISDEVTVYWVSTGVSMVGAAGDLAFTSVHSGVLETQALSFRTWPLHWSISWGSVRERLIQSLDHLVRALPALRKSSEPS
jgi:hypothetical protein